MKIKITENQIEQIFKILNEDNSSIINAPNILKLSQLAAGDENTSNNLVTNLSVDMFKNFAQSFSDLDVTTLPQELMHPLGHQSKITSDFGSRNSKIGSKNHKGVDIAAASGSPVYAPGDGVVIEAKDTTPNGCGGFIALNHGSLITKFCHLKQWSVRKNDKVKKGQVIGYSGGGINDPYRGTSTGSHLHYEIIDKNGIALNPTQVQTSLT